MGVSTCVELKELSTTMQLPTHSQSNQLGAASPNERIPRGIHGLVMLSDDELAILHRTRPNDWEAKLQRADEWLVTKEKLNVSDYLALVLRFAEQDDMKNKEKAANDRRMDGSVHFALENRGEGGYDNIFTNLFE